MERSLSRGQASTMIARSLSGGLAANAARPQEFIRDI
jgi:hypothetical protein